MLRVSSLKSGSNSNSWLSKNVIAFVIVSYKLFMSHWESLSRTKSFKEVSIVGNFIFELLVTASENLF